MKKQSGITLVALVITIIVMLILVGVTVNVTLDGKLFGTAKTAANDTQMKIDRDVVETAVFACLNRESDIYSKILIKNNLPTEWLDVTGEDGGPYTIVSPSGNKFLVLSDGEVFTLNEYGFYYDADYICRDYFGSTYINKAMITILKDGTVVLNTYQERGVREGATVNFEDFTGNRVVSIPQVEYNVEYTGTGYANSQCTYHLDSNGHIHGHIVISKDKMIYSNKNINIAGVIPSAVSEDGQSISIAGKTFKIEN